MVNLFLFNFLLLLVYFGVTFRSYLKDKLVKHYKELANEKCSDTWVKKNQDKTTNDLLTESEKELKEEKALDELIKETEKLGLYDEFVGQAENPDNMYNW